ncbi:class I SAM-dependent methyltransferase [Paenibacillus allorhizosphaerae]|uniref:Ornithine lipid N-methyltransferase n=1 Tax=Paenibacillus allorhizosphaerae TaxID=2849866 RepID=A0ABM8VDZ3_9BACL|nr:methyltransferase domain-containing protein [Paenibacillus allorhizosphaerae]CAG7629243.1 Ornithine lipid N-methyltransferase [Paenibacillus allorhizosphaerae]
MLSDTSVKSSAAGKWMFLKKFIQNPRDVGSIIPSSNRLTNKMLEPIPWDQARNVVELGAGTGIFTKAIYELARPDCKVAIFEKEDEMRSQLLEMYKGFYFCKNALDLQACLPKIGMAKADCIISGLPFANFAQSDREQIIRQVHDSLSDDGIFVTFQYSLQMKKMLQSAFAHVSVSFVAWNMPPAFVYVCRKRWINE